MSLSEQEKITLGKEAISSFFDQFETLTENDILILQIVFEAMLRP